MFETATGPRLFGLPPGADFPRKVVEGLIDRMQDQPPEAMAQVEIFVNTRRMQRRMKDLFDEGPARLLPRIRLVTDLATEAALATLPPAVPMLRRRLELTQLVAKLLDSEPDLAPRAALFDLADSLAALMDEMQGEGVPLSRIAALDVSDLSGHWARSLRFVTLVGTFMNTETEAPDAEARQRMVVDHLVRAWNDAPPEHPVIVAGSTGSRGATAAFMKAVSRLPKGALLLPGFDFDLPGAVWDGLDDAMTGEDHPQFRFARLMRDLDVGPGDVRPWIGSETAPNPARNRLVSLALRPAPVTDQWMEEGRHLTGIAEAAAGLTLIEAGSLREEANAIALVLRDAVEQGRSAALITPDRILTRQVSAALDRWNIIPDDSAGRPLPLSAPGRLLRHVSALFGRVVTSDALLTILKHPLVNSGSALRGQHLLHTRELELSLRRYGPPFPTSADLARWAETGDADRQAWAGWVSRCLNGLDEIGERPLSEHLVHHLQVTETLAAGPSTDGSGALWDKEAGREALKWVEALRREADHGGTIGPRDYDALFHNVLQRGEVRESVIAHPGVMIWGTLEARVQGADLVVLGGLNEGIWPEAARPDPWLNRRMRNAAGLLLPERRIGLSAHDFQQAIGAGEAVLTRAVRDAEAQTVPSRWINRLTNLMDGLSEESRTALASMKDRGQRWLDIAAALERPESPLPPAPRPAPRPPVEMRPRTLSITEIQTLIRDPYAIYARHVLRLRPLDPLRRLPDAPLRGTVLHKVLERFIPEMDVNDPRASKARLLEITDAVLASDAPWPAAQRMWRARLMRVADWLLQQEIARRQDRVVEALERRAEMRFPDLDLTLRGKIDRIDRLNDGRVAIYDYKTGSPPGAKVQEFFDKQLGLAAMLAESGALAGLGPERVAQIAYIGLGSSPKCETADWSVEATADIRTEFTRLIASYNDPARGYPSRRAVDLQRFDGDYDHLARFGEWDQSDAPDAQEVGR